MTEGLAFHGQPVENVRHDMKRGVFIVELEFTAKMLDRLGEGVPVSGQLGIVVDKGRVCLELRQSLDFRFDRPPHEGVIQ